MNSPAMVASSTPAAPGFWRRARAHRGFTIGGVLTLAAEDWDESDMPVGLRLVVADTGPGLTPAERERLFKPFYTARKPDGTGLGLWVSQSLVERYGGRITVDSEAGKGSRFNVWLRFEPLPA